MACAYSLCEGLVCGRGISSEDVATLWQHDLAGALRLWIEVGLPDERLLRRAAGRADQVVLYTYGGRAAARWWGQNSGALARLANLRVGDLPHASTQALAPLIKNNLPRH